MGKNVLLIDSRVRDSFIFVESCNANTIPFIYSETNTREDVLQFLQQNEQIERLGIVFETASPYIFLNNEPLFDATNRQFLIDIILQYRIANVDFLGCETLLDNEWRDFYDILKEQSGVIVGSSNDKTGNIQYGGDWVMESTSTDIEAIYFNETIQYYQYLLDPGGSHTVFIKDGIIYGCGLNYDGQLGDGTTTSPRLTYVQMTNTTGRTPESVSLGRNHTVVKMTDGTVWACGLNNTGQLCDGTTTSRSTLTQITIPAGNTVVFVTCGVFSTFLIVENTTTSVRTILGCGENTAGILGNGTTTTINSSFVTMTNTTGRIPQSLSSGGNTFFTTHVIMTDGTVWCCGQNNSGLFGNGTTSTSATTTLTQMTTIIGGRSASTVACGGNFVVIIMTDGTIWGCGVNTNGQLGTGNNDNTTSLVQMINTTGRTPITINCGNTHTIIKMNDNTVWGCGSNANGKLSDGSLTGRNSLVQMTIPAGKTVSSARGAIDTTIVQMTDGTIWGSGANGNGQIGDNTTVAKSILAQGYIDAKINPTIGALSIPSKIVGDSPFTITAPTSNSSGSFTYTSLNTNVATIAGTTVTIVGGGTSTIIATQGSDATYNSGIAVATLTVVLINPTISNFSIPSKTVGDSPFTITAPTSNSTEAFTYTSYNTAVATIVGSTITIVGGGTSTITATQAANSTYNSGTITATLTVNKLNPMTGAFSIPSKTFGDSPFTITAPTSNSTGSFTYTSDNTAVATIIGSTVTIVGAGTSTITSTQATDTNYYEDVVVATLIVDKATPTYGPFPDITKGNNAQPFTITAPTSNSTGSFTYTSSNTAVATIVGSTVTIVGAGTSTITATQATDTNYNEDYVVATLTVQNKPQPTITNFSIPSKSFGDSPFTITAPTSNSTGSFTYTSSNTAVATIVGSTVTIIGAGTSTITATQASDANYSVMTAETTLTVSKANPTIGVLSIPSKSFGDSPFTITAPTSNSTGSFTYTSSNTAVATIVGTTITILTAGTSTITASQATDTNYNSGTTTAALTVAKINPTIGALSIPSKSFGDSPFTITAPTTNSTGAFTYTSSNTAVATIVGSTITILTAGTSTITATQTTDTNYNSGTQTATLTVSKANPTIGTFSAISKTFGDSPFTITAPTSNSTGSFTYTSSNTAVATIVGTTITIVGAGSSTITATQASDTNYNSGTRTASLTVAKINPTIGTLSIPSKSFGDSPFNITAPTTNSTGSFTYTSSNTAVATIVGSTVTIVGGGTSIITARQASDTNYRSGTTTATLTVSKANPTIGTLSNISKSFGDSPFTITAPTTNSTGAFTYTSSNTAVATIVGSTVTIVGAGTSTITATQGTDTNYNEGTTTSTLTVSKANPTIGTLSIPSKSFGDSPFTITAPTTNSTGAFTYTSSNTDVATIVGTTITILTAGTSTITATQATDTNYNEGTTTATLTVAKINPTIGTFSAISKSFGDSPFTITAPTTNSTGAFTYTSSNTAVATIVGNTITIVGAGTSTITATQATDTNYNSGTQTATLTVTKINPTIGTFSAISKNYGDSPFTITAPTSNSTGSFTYTSSNTAVATIVGSTITILTAGTSTITATQTTDTNYNSGTQTATLTVSKANPTIGTFSAISKTFGDSPFTITAPTSNSTGSFTYTSSNTDVATIVGSTVTIVGAGTSTITATQATDTNYNSGTTTATLTVTKINPTIGALSIPSKTFEDSPFTITAPTTNSTGAFTYTSSNTAVATIVGTTITIVGLGSSTITATQATDTNYNSGTQTGTLTVSIANPTIGALSIPSKSFGDSPFTITAPTTNSTGAFTYTSSNTAVATIVGSTVTILTAGTSTITATQAIDTNYNSGTTTATLTVAKINPTIGTLSIPSKSFGDSPFTITAPTTNSTGAFTYTSSNTSVATIVGNTITIVGGGTSTITATQATDTNYNSGTTTATITVAKINPTIGTFSAISKSFGDSPFTITAPTTNSTGAFTYTSSNTAVATIVGSTVTILTAGTSTITATQATDTNYNSGTTTATLTVAKINPTIGTFSAISKSIGDSPFTITAPTSNSTGAFTYTSSNTAVATIVGSTVTIVGAGTSTITATQATDTNYNSGTTTATLTVAKINPTISTFSDIRKSVGNPPFTVTAPTTNSTGSFTYTSSNTAVATIVGTTITIVGLGSSTITATQASDANYNEAIVSKTLNVLIVTVEDGYTIPQLIALGYTNSQILAAGYTITELRDAGFSALQLKENGYTVSQLRNVGYSIFQYKNAGFTASDMKTGGYYYYELLDAGYTTAELLEAGFTGFPQCLKFLFKTSYTDTTTSNSGQCQPQALPLTKKGLSNGTNGTNGTNPTTTASPCGSTNSLNTSTNQTGISNRMRFSQQVQTYGTTKSSTSYPKKTCRIGGPTFSY